MAQASRVKRFHAHTKRENSLLKREITRLQYERGQTTALMMAMLLENNGDITISQDTTDILNRDIARMGYKIDKSDDNAQLVRVTLVMQPAEPEAPAPVEPPKPTSMIHLTDMGDTHAITI